MASAALDHFESLTSQIAKPDALVEATRESFGIIAPWATASSTSHSLQETIASLRREATSFLRSVSQSYKNAQTGYTFAKRAAHMCNSLLEPKNTKEGVEALIREMRGIAQRAHKDATTTANMFRDNRTNFNNAFTNMPATLEAMKLEYKQDQEKKIKADTKADTWSDMVEKLLPIGTRAKKRNRKRSDRLGATPSQEGGDKESSRNPLHVAGALLSLPVTFPIVIVAKSRQAAEVAKAEEADKRIVGFGAAVANFRDAEQRLEKLAQNMNTMADYWLAMDVTLEDIHDRVDELCQDATLHIKIRSLAIDWNQVALDYGSYKTQLALLKDTNLEIKAITEGNEGTSGPSPRRK